MRHIHSDLARLDDLRDEDIDLDDAPTPNLGDWVREARPFTTGGAGPWSSDDLPP